MSSAILYLGIVLIWACVLIPRWLRRDHSVTATDDLEQPETSPVEWEEDETPVLADVPTAPVSEPAPIGPERRRVLAARRRMLGMLVALLVAATALAGLKLAAWWVLLPPTVMLLGYTLLLREAAHADAERAAAAESRSRSRTRAPRVPVAEPVVAPQPQAEIITLASAAEEDYEETADEGLYDQYTDARLRAVGD